MPKQQAPEHAFRATAQALDDLPAKQENVFLARLVLIMAQELNDPAKFDEMVRRAARAQVQQP